MLVAWRLVAEHHKGAGYVVRVEEGDVVTHVGLVDDLGTIACASPCDESSDAFVVEGFTNTDTMVEKLHVKRTDHVFPIAVVG